MAKLFKGMSKDSFLDDLVQLTNKNGQELYDYLVGLVSQNKPEEEVIEKETPQSTRRIDFAGSRNQLYEYLERHGGVRYITMNGKIQDAFSCASEDALANYAAKVMNTDLFVWTRQYMNGGTYQVCGVRENLRKS